MTLWIYINVLAKFERISTLLISIFCKGWSYSQWYFTRKKYRVCNRLYICYTALFDLLNALRICLRSSNSFNQTSMLCLVMNFDGVSCWVWVFSQAKRLLFEIVLNLLNTTELWNKYLVVKLAVIKFFSLCFWVELNSVLLLYYQIAECCDFMFTICLSYFRSGLLLFMSSKITRKDQLSIPAFCPWCLRELI